MTKLKGVDKKNQLIIGTLIILFLIILVVIYIYVFNKHRESLPVAVVNNEGDLAINYLDGNNINIVNPKDGQYEYVISVTNTGTKKIYYSIYLNNIESDIEKASIVLERENGDTLYNNTIKKGDNLLFKLNSIEPSLTDRYVLKINNDKNRSDIKGIIKVVNESMTEETFADIILDNNNLSLKHTHPGIDLSTNNEGLIKDEDDLGVTYYFRGNVDNNYLMIGDYLFRIVRINGDGTVRIVLDQETNLMTSFNNIDVNINDIALFNNSLVYQALNNWIESNFALYKEYFADGSFCSDNNFINVNGDNKNSNVYQRIYVNGTPSLKCNGHIDRLRVGLLSADEIVYAGAVKDYENKEYYLYNPSISYDSWTVSSSGINLNNNTYMIVLNKKGNLESGTLINDTLGVRPVINLSVGSHIKGEGTKDNPYILVY